MGFEDKYKKDQKHYDKKVYRSQKVKMYRLKHWIFDFGGVMVEGANAVQKVIDQINSDIGCSLSKEDPFFMKTRRRLSSGRLTAEEFLERVIENYYTSRDETAKEVDVEPYLDLWFQTYSKLTQISPEMEEIVERLHKAGFHVSLMSNTYGIHAKSNELKGFFDLFDNVFLSNELKMRKPDIEKYKYVIKKLDAKPKESIFIDDKLINLVPATKLGIKVICFESFEVFQNCLNDLGIEKINKNFKDKISKKYKSYKTSIKEFKDSKKKVKKLKSELKKLKKKKKRSKYKKLAKELRYHEAVYKKKKHNYEKQKKFKKEILEPKLKLHKEE